MPMKRNRMTGHVWDLPVTVSPQLICATNCFYPPQANAHSSLYPHWVLDYNFRESDEYQVGSNTGRWKHRESHVAHLYSPNTVYWERNVVNSPEVHCAWVIFSGGEQAGLNDLVSGKGYARFLDRGERLAGVLMEAASVGQAEGDEGFWAAQGVLCKLIGMLHEAEPQGGGLFHIVPPAGQSDMVRQARKFMRSHLAESITLRDIATHLHVSSSTLSHSYKRQTGKSPMTELIAMRIAQARNLLLRGYRLKTIAEQTGFSDEFHLSKTFKRVEGITPRQAASQD